MGNKEWCEDDEISKVIKSTLFCTLPTLKCDVELWAIQDDSDIVDNSWFSLILFGGTSRKKYLSRLLLINHKKAINCLYDALLFACSSIYFQRELCLARARVSNNNGLWKIRVEIYTMDVSWAWKWKAQVPIKVINFYAYKYC